MVEGIPAAEYARHRERLLPFIENVAARNTDGASVESYERRILSGQMQVWNINDFQAVALTFITPEAVKIHAATGVRRHEWQEELDETIREWARALGKKRIVAVVRPGWAPWGRERGYKEKHREMVLELSNV